MRRCTVLQRGQQEAEFLFRLVLLDAQQFEDLRLHVLAMDTHRTATDFVAVQHHVVTPRDNAVELAGELFRRVDLRRGEGMVHGIVAAILVVVFEHREVDDPQRRPLALDHVAVVADLLAQRAERVIDHLGLVGTEEHQVAVGSRRRVEDALAGLVRQELDDRRLQAFLALGHVVDLDVGQSLGAIATDKAGVLVDFLAADFVAARDLQRGDAAVRILRRAGKDLEVAVRDHVGHFHEFQRDAGIRLVRTEALHGLGIRHAREGGRQVDVQGLAEGSTHHLFHQAHDAFLVHEGGLDIELGEFRLAVGAQVLVTEALDDLVVTIEARHHQELLEDLRRLRQREELARMGARRHQVVTRAFRRGLGQHRGFDVDEAGRVHVTANAGGQVVAQAQAALHLGTTQVDVAVLEAVLFTDLVRLVQLERRRLGRVQDVHLAGIDFHLARLQLGILGALGATTNLAGDLEDVLGAHALAFFEHVLLVRIHHHLQQTVPVAQVDENHATVVTPAMHPAAYRNLLIQKGFIYLSAIMTAHLHFQLSGARGARNEKMPAHTGQKRRDIKFFRQLPQPKGPLDGPVRGRWRVWKVRELTGFSASQGGGNTGRLATFRNALILSRRLPSARGRFGIAQTDVEFPTR